MWGVTPHQSDPYIDHRLREEMFREAVISFLIPKDKDPKRLEAEYCRACRKARPNADCSKCDKSRISVVKEVE